MAMKLWEKREEKEGHELESLGSIMMGFESEIEINEVFGSC